MSKNYGTPRMDQLSDTGSRLLPLLAGSNRSMVDTYHCGRLSKRSGVRDIFGSRPGGCMSADYAVRFESADTSEKTGTVICIGYITSMVQASNQQQQGMCTIGTKCQPKCKTAGFHTDPDADFERCAFKYTR